MSGVVMSVDSPFRTVQVVPFFTASAWKAPVPQSLVVVVEGAFDGFAAAALALTEAPGLSLGPGLVEAEASVLLLAVVLTSGLAFVPAAGLPAWLIAAGGGSGRAVDTPVVAGRATAIPVPINAMPAAVAAALSHSRVFTCRTP
ncbi:hypothetical protein FB565_000077 [Actinoplanes lutulentus]|uniref:hypothetical protein n=1 Tax=Actinoplanes lutulentus TaxID=1287878 RepID=UPI0015EC24CA|nr:hypothetical protein [Actinoplanes lutulentus]MBB2940373.1 hypothetical protein [Actinoplanes lutulentus]